MSSAEDRIEDPFIPDNSMSFPQHDEHTAQKRKMSHSDHIDDGTSPIHVDPNPTTSSHSDAEDIKVAYNGPATIYVVMLRVSNESSARPMPQAAFFDRNKALAFATRILLQWCNAHYDDYIWKGPEILRNGLVERYAAYHAQIGQQLAVADVIRVSVFDAQETEVVLKKEEKKDVEESEEEEDKLDDAEHHSPLEEESEENSEDIGILPVLKAIGSMTDTRTATYSSHSTQTQEQDFGRFLPLEVLSGQGLTFTQERPTLIQPKLRNKKLTLVSA